MVLTVKKRTENLFGEPGHKRTRTILIETPLLKINIKYTAKTKKSNKSGNLGTPNGVLVTLGFFCTFQAEKFILISKLSRHRAGGTDTALVF